MTHGLSHATKLALGALGALLLAAAPASAATRYAASGGSSAAPCTSGSPCDLATAVGGASAGDTVVLAPGDYTVTNGVSTSNAITIQGQAGQARPRLFSNGVNSTVELSAGGTVNHVYVESDSSTASSLTIKGGTAYDVIAYAPSADSVTLKTGSNGGPTDTLFRDSVASTDAPGAAAIGVKSGQNTGAVKILNVSAYGHGAGAYGITSKLSSGSLSVVNTIARGDTGGDIVRTQYTAPISVSYSAFRSFASPGVTAGAGNVCANSPFVDSTSAASSADLHESSTSPTIDGGTTDPDLGAADPDGNARTRGTAPDIGAYESALTGSGAGSSTSGFCAAATGTSGTTEGGLTSNPGPGSDSTPGPHLPPAAPPAFATSVAVGAASGTVTVTLPGAAAPVTLAGAASIPVGSTIDATHGVVRLTSTRDAAGSTQTGSFWGGAFKVGQNRQDGYTELSLAGSPLACGTRARIDAHAARGSATRQLWGSDHHGRFRTRGSRAVATVRGTVWLTEDRCDGTLMRVKKGAIVVRDLGRRRNVLLSAGRSYLAKAPARSRHS